MNRKAIILLTLFLSTLLPAFLFAQDVETIISADQITVQTDNILIATGNVTVQWGCFN